MRKLNDLQIFSNEEFGQVRTVALDSGFWFVGKDVANALGYSNSRDAIATHVEPEDKGVRKFDTLGGKQNLVIINESGLYSLIFGSRLKSAKRFKRWVTAEVLPALHKTGHYETQNYSPEMQAILMHDKKLVKMDERVTTLENTMTIDYAQQQALKETVNYIVVDALGGKGSEAYLLYFDVAYWKLQPVSALFDADCAVFPGSPDRAGCCHKDAQSNPHNRFS